MFIKRVVRGLPVIFQKNEKTNVKYDVNKNVRL